MVGSKLKEISLMRWLSAIALVAMVVINALANMLPIAGIKTGEVSDAYPNLFAPTGFTFAIWGVIYALLIFFTLYQLSVLKVKKPTLKPAIAEKINKYFLVSSLANIAWIFCWHYQQIGLSVVLIVAILVCLIRINYLISKSNLTTKENWLVKVPFGVYFSWITVATIANITVWLVSIGWVGFGLSQGFWTVAILIIGAIIGIVTMFKNSDWAYGAVFIWAYAGILTKHLSDTGWNGQWPSVQAALYIVLPILIMMTFDIARRELPKTMSNKKIS